ncbi:MAG: YigZ family protein [Treponema sp.]|nr:YigZ family protein [Treponema sp.]
MKVLLEYCTAESKVKNSRFIAEAFPIKTAEEARAKLSEQKEKYADARHVVHAFFAGTKAEVSGLSDDGEPSGTAGRPVFEVLKGSGITNIILTVTRYFGGTLLGTGGLVKAYQDAAKQVLAIAKAEEYVEKNSFSLSTDYATYKLIKHIYPRYHISGLQEGYTSSVDVSGQIVAKEGEEFQKEVFNVSKGKTTVEVKTCT